MMALKVNFEWWLGPGGSDGGVVYCPEIAAANICAGENGVAVGRVRGRRKYGCAVPRTAIPGFIYDANTGGIVNGHIFEAALGSVRGVLFLDIPDSVRRQRLLNR